MDHYSSYSSSVINNIIDLYRFWNEADGYLDGNGLSESAYSYFTSNSSNFTTAKNRMLSDIIGRITSSNISNW